MTQLTYDVIDGKAAWGGRSLAAWVPVAVDRIVAVFAPAEVVLFGSVARGDDGADSDIDLLVVFDHINGRHHEQAVAVQRCLEDVGAPVDVLVTDAADLAARGGEPGVLRVARREGRLVYQRAA
jgi:predicted nucleotidyltransferase